MPISQEVSPHEVLESKLRLTLSAVNLAELIPQLEDLFLRDGNELRLDLPQNWIIFWKKRADESRILIAHPNPGEWVATAALEISHGKDLIMALKDLQPGQTVEMSEMGRVGGVSNTEIAISRSED